jgi:uncharacterized protein YyaL (SSP411 family)
MNRKNSYFLRTCILVIIFFTGTILFPSISSSSNKKIKEKDTMEKKTHIHTNRLIHEKSPYLLQHAHNPVDWYPWGEEAFEKARKENKPIFLSIGYSTCHWCHVMEHESFEDSEVAELMNQVFVSIKVDREERPDLDNIYMTVIQLMTGSGGWPLTIFMTPEKKPFFAATYIPKESRFGRVGMLELIPRIRDMWNTKHESLAEAADRVTRALQNNNKSTLGAELDKSVFDKAFSQLAARFDKERGGFSPAPKFPTPHNLLFLLHYWKRTGNDNAREMVQKTLQAMYHGGMYDHLGYGFHRYSTDSHWLVPHFEKMLYDQALLAIAYIEAYEATHKEEYKKVAEEIFTYVLRDMTDPEGGFYSGEDADSEGVEGKFYVWTEQEVRQALDEKAGDIFIKVYNVERDGNFRDEATQEKTGTNILHLKKSLKETAQELKMSYDDLISTVKDSQQKIFSLRQKRVHPHKDDKILVDWNGLMIAALARGARTFGNPDYAESAAKAIDFILKKVTTPKGRLLHRYRDGEAAINAHIDDYAFFIQGLIELYETTFNASYLKTALSLNEDMIKHFRDDDNGGFYFTADDSEKLLVRQKEFYDSALPAGNSVSMLNLLRLSRITGQEDFESKALRIAEASSQSISQTPSIHTQLLLALDFSFGPSFEIVIVGKSGADDTAAMIKALRTVFEPNKVVIFRPEEEKSPEISSLADFTQHMTTIDGKATAYVCLNYSCKKPTTDAKEMAALIKTGEQVNQ